MKTNKRKRKRTQHNPSCYLIAPIQKGFPVTDFTITKDQLWLIAGNAFGCVTAYKVPPDIENDDIPQEDEKKVDSDVFECYRLQKYGNAAVRHIWIQSDEKQEDEVYAVIGFQQVCIWPLGDILEPSRCGKTGCRPKKKPISHKFDNYPTEIFTIMHGTQLAMFAAGSDIMHLVDFSNRRIEEFIQTTHYKLGVKTEVVSFDGKAFCFLNLNPKTGQRKLIFRDAKTFKQYSESMFFERVGTNYSCFQLVDRQLSYCSNNNVVKVYDLDKKEVVHRCKGHKGYILATHFDGDIIATLGTDRKLKLWQNGECIHKIKNIPGVFNPGYLYKIWHNKSRVYYSADEGIYVAYIK